MSFDPGQHFGGHANVHFVCESTHARCTYIHRRTGAYPSFYSSLCSSSLPPPFLPFFSLSYISSFHHTHTHHHISPSLLPSFSHQERRKQSARRVDRDLLRGHWAEGVDGTTADAEADKTALALVSALSACAATWWEYANLYK